jgi:methylmalonyl-CoA/ethylmalonyl-CoA epimerase
MKIKRVEHIAIAVDSLNQSAAMLRDAFGIDVEYEEQVGSTRLAMLPVGETYIELLESAAPDSGVSQWIRDKGAGLFHICFEVEDIDGALAELKAKGVKLRDETPRIGHGGARIAFLDPASTGNVLIELAELPPGH